MKQYLILIFSIVFSFISCSSDTPNNEEVVTEGDDKVVENGNSLLWKIEKEGAKTSYMYGTMHMIDAEYFHFTDKMTKLAKESDAIVMEVGGMPNPLKTMELMKLDTGDIRSIFTKEEMKTIVGFFDKELGMEPDAFFEVYGQMKPFFILQAISQNYFSSETESYDLQFMSIAGKNEIPLIGLETIEQQLGFFDTIPQEAMNSLIVESIENFKKEKKSTEKMMEIYSEQRVDKLIPLMKKQSPEFMDYSDVFLYDRNKAWIPKIKKEMESKRIFIAVGAAHLFGDGGVIDLLKKEGYKVTPISTED
ncbi:TraB/GumN family protein [Paracrocinitomix mangrovi]|uniref:TraB/GumN family protein n=1 Tax=Paracrocinitomix mangrovi TaxID=2862509 RepID=UPI001C8D1E86|nr:TraB/GumN family protein [Paracrocinitomix mangrovi]UKN01494.1 TraB/GumN family protein [Paracrocinitomix mangrovi]